MKDLILTPYAPNLIESTRNIGYSFETALADIIDNSISNFATRVDVNFSDSEDPYVAIIDNGKGMTKEELENAMRYGSSNSLETRSEHDLGRFGLGLKMASMSQCRKLTVISKVDNEISAVSWDLDYIYRTKDWRLIRYTKVEIKKIKFYKELLKQDNGTIVLWENLDRIAESKDDFKKEFNEKLDFADKHLSLVFHRFLDSTSSKEYFEIYFNNRKLVSIDPFMTKNKATQKLEDETLFINKEKIRITPYITPYINKLSSEERQLMNEYKDLNLKQGLYIYRNKRLIVWGKWFRLLGDSELKKLAKIQIDLPNNIDDFWTIDVKKSSAQIPSIIKVPLKQIVLRAAGKSERVYKYRGRKISKDNFEHIWNKIENRENIQYLINKDIPMYNLLKNSLNENQVILLENFVKSIEDAFPYAAVYYDLAKDKKFEERTLEEEDVYQMIKTIVNNADSFDEQKNCIKKIKDIDMFSKYPEIVELIDEEIDNE